MNVSNKSLHIENEGFSEVMNLKCHHALIGELLLRKGVLPAYHMNKEHWISVLLTEECELSREEVISLIDLSYELTNTTHR